MAATTDQTESSAYRLVDAQNQGWYSAAAGTYEADYGFQRGLPTLTFSQLQADRGPLRPVQPITGDDEKWLRSLFDTAGRKAIATLAAALESVFHEIREHQGGLGGATNSYNYAERTLRA